MKRVKFIFIFGIIIGLLFIGGNVLKGNTSSIDKKEVSSPNVSSDFYGGISTSFNFYNIDENGNDLNGSRFKLTTWDGTQTFYSGYENNDSYIVYYFSGHKEKSFSDIYKLLSNEQKRAIENVRTVNDIKNNWDYNKEEYFCNHYDDGGEGENYCGLVMPTYFILEQSKVASGYEKQKYVVLGDVYVYFILTDYHGGTGDEEITNDLTGNEELLLESIYLEQAYNGILLTYGNYENTLLKANHSNEVLNVIDNNVIYDEEFCRTHFELFSGPDGAVVESGLNALQKKYGNQALSSPIITARPGISYWDCPMVVVNKKGSVNLSINTTVNEKESISTTSNSKLKYRVNVTNTGVDSYDNTVVSKLPEEFVYVDGTASNGGVYDPKNHTITWTVYRIAEGDNIVLTYEAYAPNGLSSLKSYIGEASVQSSTSQKVVSNKTTVRLMANPKTNAPLYGIGITLLITWGVALYLYLDNKRKLIKN